MVSLEADLGRWWSSLVEVATTDIPDCPFTFIVNGIPMDTSTYLKCKSVGREMTTFMDDVFMVLY